MYDPIIEEIYKAREKLLAECGGDLKKLMERYKDSEARDKHRLADPKAVLAKSKHRKPQIVKEQIEH